MLSLSREPCLWDPSTLLLSHHSDHSPVWPARPQVWHYKGRWLRVGPWRASWALTRCDISLIQTHTLFTFLCWHPARVLWCMSWPAKRLRRGYDSAEVKWAMPLWSHWMAQSYCWRRNAKNLVTLSQIILQSVSQKNAVFYLMPISLKELWSWDKAYLCVAEDRAVTWSYNTTQHGTWFVTPSIWWLTKRLALSDEAVICLCSLSESLLWPQPVSALPSPPQAANEVILIWLKLSPLCAAWVRPYSSRQRP